jgi:hypothetical protein
MTKIIQLEKQDPLPLKGKTPYSVVNFKQQLSNLARILFFPLSLRSIAAKDGGYPFKGRGIRFELIYLFKKDPLQDLSHQQFFPTAQSPVNPFRL